MKPKLVSTAPYTLYSQWVMPIVTEYFDLVEYSADVTYQSQDCYYTNQWDSIAMEWAQAGRKVVMDRLWEPAFRPHDPMPCYVLQNWNWFWYQESLWYKHLGYDQYMPNPNWTHHALMPMRVKKAPRDYIVRYIGSELDRFVWSYQAIGRNLPNGGDFDDWAAQRLFRPEWYDATAMSLVVETCADSNGTNHPLVSEKTLKPMAFRHPFVVCGDSGTLAFLQSLGFETFDNLFDESYDKIHPWQQRIRAAIDQCLQYQPQQYDTITQEKLAHNHALFFNQQLVISRIQKEILEPLLNYAET